MIFKFSKKQAQEIAYGTKKNPKTKAPNPLEKDIEKAVCEHAKGLGFLVYKFTSISRRSVPDRLLITPKGTVFFIEFKRRGTVPTDAQEIEIKRIRGTGVAVYVVDNKEAGRCLISDIFHGAKKASLDINDY